MRRAARTDATQAEIVKALRRCGVVVQPLHKVGDGCPDLLCAFRGKNLLLEVKTPKGSLTPIQERWHAEWKGQVAVVDSVERAVGVVLGEP